MWKVSTLHRLLIPIAVLIIISALALAYLESQNQVEAIGQNARILAQNQTRLLNLTESLVGERVKTSMALLKAHSALLGAPNINGSIKLNEKNIPSLYLGKIPQTKNQKLVDDVTAISGGTATLFVKSGDDFVRITTNIMQNDKERAIGTILDPHGKAIKAIKAGNSFYGVLDILGSPYITGYEPMFSEFGEVIGVWYVGYPANMTALKESIKDIHFLRSGFAAMLDANNEIRFLSNSISLSDAKSLLAKSPSTWEFIEEKVPSWDFKVVIAYPKSEALAVAMEKGLFALFIGFIILIALMAIFVSRLKKLVINPIGGDPEQAINMVHAISSGNLDDDGIVAHEGTLMSDMLHMRQNLRQMVTTLKQNADNLSLAASVFDHAHDAIFITDERVRIVQINPAFEKITGYQAHEAIGKHPREIHLADFSARTISHLEEEVRRSGQWSGEIQNRHKSGKIYVASIDVSAVKDDEGKVSHYVGIFSDITLLKQQHANLKHMAHHDPLTKLPNRTLFSDRLQQALARSHRNREKIAVCYFDLDGFKPVNDLLGHDAGDELLIQLAERIREILRMGDTIARMGGDEFALLLCDLKTTKEAHGTLKRILDFIKLPFSIQNQEIRISASAGLILNINPKSKPEDLIRQADHAMYQAKLIGDGTYFCANDEEMPDPEI